MILEYVKSGVYKVTDNGKTIGTIKKYFMNFITKERIHNFRTQYCDPKFVRQNGYEVTWASGNTERITNLAELSDKYTFENYPGPRNVLRRDKRFNKS